MRNSKFSIEPALFLLSVFCFLSSYLLPHDIFYNIHIWLSDYLHKCPHQSVGPIGTGSGITSGSLYLPSGGTCFPTIPSSHFVIVGCSIFNINIFLSTVCLLPCVYMCVCLSLSLSHTHTHTRAPAHTTHLFRRTESLRFFTWWSTQPIWWQWTPQNQRRCGMLTLEHPTIWRATWNGSHTLRNWNSRG